MGVLKLLGIFVVVCVLFGFATKSLANDAYCAPEREVYQEVCKGNQCEITFTEVICSPDRYKQIIYQLDHATSGAVLVFHLTGYGGDAYSLEAFVKALKSTRAYVIMIVEGDVYSAHAYLAVSGNELHTARGTRLMFHDVQFSRNDPNDEEQQRSRKEFQVWVLNNFGKFFTQSEIAFMFSDPANELYIWGPDMEKRFNALRGK